MHSSPSCLAIVLEPAAAGPHTRLEATHDANEATVAFHNVLRLPRTQGIDGDPLLHQQDDQRLELLRQPVMAGGR